MALREPIKITIGAENFIIRTFTLKQLLELERALKPAESGESVRQIEKILAVALSRDHSDNASAVSELECNGAEELRDAMNAILRFTGFLQEEPAPLAVA